MFVTPLRTTLTLFFLALVLATSFVSGSATPASAATGAGASSAPDFSLSANPTSQTIERGGTAVYAIHIGAINGFTGTVMLTDTDPFAKTVPFFTDLSGNEIFPPVTIHGSGVLL